MLFLPTPIPDAFVVQPEPSLDERGLFARTFCADEFRAHGLAPTVAQCSVSHNPRRGTLRGMHLQVAPAAMAKLVRVTRGAAFDVAIDLRPGSPALRRWHGVVLDADNRLSFYVPEGVAHGFVTLEDDTEVVYQMSVAYDPACGRGVRWDDPAFGIEWPIPPVVMNERDRSWADFDA